MARIKIKDENQAEAPAPEAPSTQVVNAAVTSKQVVTSDGRTIVVSKVSPMRRMRLFDAIGPEAARNDKYIGMAMLAAAVTHIDGERVPFPQTKREVEALVERLDDSGLEAAAMAISDIMGIQTDDNGNVIDGRGNVLVAAKN